MIGLSFLSFLLFTMYPMIQSLVMSFFDWKIVGQPKPVGVANYSELAGDAYFWTSLKNTLYFTLGTVPVRTALALILAVALNGRIRMRTLFRAVYFLPEITSMVAVALIWRWIYNPDFGLLNQALRVLGISPGPTWLSSVTWAMPSVVIMSIWKNVGYYMVLFLAGLQAIPDHYYEAARIDGANAVHQFLRITVPLISPITLFVLIMSIIASFQVFQQIYIMTQGGPMNSTSVVVYYLFENAFVYFRLGYASAVAWVLFLIILVVTVLQMRYSRTWVRT